MKVRDLIRLLQENRWKLNRQMGSHRQLVRDNNPNALAMMALTSRWAR